LAPPWRPLGGHGDIGHDFAIHNQGWVGLVQQIDGFPDLVAQRMPGAAKVREGEHGNARHNIKTPGFLSRAQGNFHQVFRRGIDIDAGVCEEQQLSVLGNEGIASRNLMQTFAHAHDLQRGTNGVGKVLGHARD
jgi:hypothetical protein